LRTNAPGTTVLGGLTVTTTQDQFYGDDVVLLQNTTLAGDDVTFDKKLNGTFDLTINTTTPTGVTRFNGAVGGDAPLRNLVTNALGTTVLGGFAITTTEDQFYGDPVVVANHVILDGDDITFTSTVDNDPAGPWDLTVDADQIATFNGAVGSARPLRDLIVSTGGVSTGPFTLAVPVTVTRDVLIDVRESSAATADDDLTLLATAQIAARRNVRLRAGDDVSILSGATVDAGGTLTIVGDFGDNDVFATTITTTTATPTITDAVGMLRGAGGIQIFGGDDSTDFINLQAKRLQTGGVATVNGYLTSAAASGNDEFLLVFGADETLDVAQLVINGGDEPGDDRLTVEHSKDATSRKVAAQYTTNFPGGAASPMLDGSAARFTGYGTAAGFTVDGIDKYFLRAGSAVHDHVLIRANDQALPPVLTGGDAQLEQSIKVSADASQQWQLSGWESGQLQGSNVRDVILNDTGIPMLLVGGPGNDTIVGGSSVDVIFGGAGSPLFNVGAPDMLLTPAMFPMINPAETVVRPGDYLVGRGGNDFLFADVDLFRDGPTLWGQVTLDQAGESDVIEGAAPGTAPVGETNHGAQFGAFDIIRNITGMLVDGGGIKDVMTWLRATPMLANLGPGLTSSTLNMLIDNAFRANLPGIGKVGILAPPFNALLDDFLIPQQPLPAVVPATTAALTAAPDGSTPSYSGAARSAPQRRTGFNADGDVDAGAPLGAAEIDAVFARWA
ncbi:MAG: hypothetical protein IT424_11870, partial [Pirellulales bacterium]|nr:hypothetical protein [Pirellulales bacterium]